jgi:tetratricopeptide (TPR) repeat protein
MGRYFDEIRRIVERHGGTVEKFIGDAVMAVFGIPQAHEDDALRAVRAVAEVRDRLAALGEELSLALSFRTGVNTGEVVAGVGETLVTGDAVNVAARLEQSAAAGEILVGAETLALVRDAVAVEPVEPLALKGKREPVPAFRLVSVDMAAEAFARHMDAPLVGRIREQQRLSADFESAVSERACHLFTLLGTAGVGKSRLVSEFLATVSRDADVLRGRCLHYGEDITYWPLVEVLIPMGVEPGDVIGATPADTQLEFRRLVESRARERPQVLVFDDIQWAESGFLDLIEYLADWSRDAPVFLLCVARPDLLELRPSWGGGKLNATTILLEPLTAEDCELLVSRLAGGDSLTDEKRDQILRAAEGNPLFIEEMLALVDEEGGGDDVVVPPTIQALLQARLDRLGVGERDVIGRGAVEGQVFHRGVVQELAPEPERADVATHLLSLVRKELIRSEQPTFPDEEAFRFRHLLIRDAAYDALPKETRAGLHESFADWLERHASLVELDEIVGYHLECAYRNRVELDGTDPRLENLGGRAVTRLRAAARGAQRHGDYAAACGLLERAAAFLPPNDLGRLELLLQLCRPLIEAGRNEDARGVAAELLASPDQRFVAFGRLTYEMALAYAGTFDTERAHASIAFAEDVFADDDHLGQAWTARLQAIDHWFALRSVACADAARRAEQHAVAAGEDVIAGFVRKLKSAPLSAGPIPVDEALAQARAMADAATGTVELSEIDGVLGKLLAMRGEADAALTHVRRAAEGLREAGLLVEASATAMPQSFVEQRAGHPEAAERLLREGIDELERLGAHSYKGTASLELAELLASRGGYEEAASLCTTLRGVVNEDDLTDVIGLDGLQGFLAALQGDYVEGERLTHRAVQAASEIDFYDQKATAYGWRCRVLAMSGREAEARDAAAKALAIYEAKGDRPAAASARELLDSLPASG